MEENERFLVYLSQFNLTVKKIGTLLEQMDEVSLDAFLKHNFSNLFSQETYAHMQEQANERLFNQYLANLKEKNIKIVTKFSREYPSRLKGLDDSPYYLFCKGNLSLFETHCIAVVGTRNPTNYGKIMTDRLTEGLASAGVTVVSGLAVGVDSISHRKALEVGGNTIAVLGCGFNRIYPAQHTDLAREISEKGLLVSEFCPSVPPTRYNFPQRNRIIAGLSEGVLITEAAMNSGTTHTRDFALEYGRDVYALPGNVTSEKSELTNDIIKAGQGQPVTSANDILLSMGLNENKKVKKVVQLDVIEQKIANLLKNGEKDIDYLSENSNLNVNSLNSYLTMMEINGIIRRMPGGLYCLT